MMPDILAKTDGLMRCLGENIVNFVYFLHTLLVFFVCLCCVFYVLITSSSRLTEVTALAQWCLISVHIFLPNLCQLSGITAMVFSAFIVEKSKNKITKGRLFTGLSVCLLNNRSVHSSVRSFILNASACLSVCLM